MQYVNWLKSFELACQAAHKFGLFISFDPGDGEEEILKAAPYLKDHLMVVADGQAVFFFDSAEEMWEMFNLTVGDDGPTEMNSYNGPCRVFATICDNQGKGITENT